MAKRPAFTIIEVLVITGLVASLLVFTSLNLLSPQRSSALESTTTTLNSDLRHQQLQAMTGTSEAGTMESISMPTRTSCFPAQLLLLVIRPIFLSL